MGKFGRIGIIACLVGLSSLALAGHFAIEGVSTGIEFTPQPGGGTPDASPGMVTGTCGGGNGTGTIGGSVTTTYKWVKSQVGGVDVAGDVAPTHVIAIQSCTLTTEAKSYFGSGYAAPTGESNNGLGTTWTTNLSPSATTIYAGGGGYVIAIGTKKNTSSIGTKAEIIPVTPASGGTAATFTVTSSPSASASAGNGTFSLHIDYTVAVYPVTMSIAGPLIDADGNYKILPGQLAVGTLGIGGPSVTVKTGTYQWSADGDTFLDFVVSTGDETGTPTYLETADWKVPNPSWRWVHADSVSVTATAELLYQPDSYASASIGTVSATKTVSIETVPYEINLLAARDGHLSGTIMYANPVGQHAVDFLYDATTPTEFISGADKGKCWFTQLLVNTEYKLNGAVRKTSASASNANDKTCLDLHFLYDFSDKDIDADGSYGNANDSPWWGATVDLPAYESFTAHLGATSYCMYRAPGGTSKPVPLGYQRWTWDAAMTRASGGGWNMTTNHSAKDGDASNSNFHPSWTHKDLRNVS